MVADDVKRGSIPIRLVNQAKIEEQKYIEKMKVLGVVDRKEACGSNVIRTKWVVTNKGMRCCRPDIVVDIFLYVGLSCRSLKSA